MAECTTKRKLTSKPAFEWVPDYLETQQSIKANIVSMSAHAAKNIKFGMEVTNSVKHALFLDHLNSDRFWQESGEMEPESLNSHKTFREDTDEDNLSEHTEIPCHTVFDVKFDL